MVDVLNSVSTMVPEREENHVIENSLHPHVYVLLLFSFHRWFSTGFGNSVSDEELDSGYYSVIKTHYLPQI